MPWDTPNLKTVRGLVRDNIRASLPGADASVPNSVLRVLSDSQGALCHLVLQYIDWLALQVLPDTAETEWLDRHGVIWLTNSDGTKGRKRATFAEGTGTITGISGTVIPAGALLTGAGSAGGYETIEDTTIGTSATLAHVRALDAGTIGNLESGASLGLVAPVSGADTTFIVVSITGGFEAESDDDLRARVLQRIQNPPLGGTAANYVTWALAVPGVTRAWAAPEQGVGTITVRFLMDEARPPDGWPNADDVQTVHDYINTMRPVTVKDCYVFAPIKEFIDVTIDNLVPNTVEVAAAIRQSLLNMLSERAEPGQTIYAAWISYAIMNAPGVESFNLVTDADHIMPSLGNMAVLGTVTIEPAP